MKRDRLHNKQLLSETSDDKDLLFFLSKNKRSNIRRGVAKNINTSAYIIENLMNDNNIEVVVEVCRRHDLSYEMFKSLFDRKMHAITVQLTKNSKLPEDIQIQILNNDLNYISYHFDIAKHTKSQEAINLIISHEYVCHRGNVMCHLLDNPNLTKENIKNIFDMISSGIAFYNSEVIAHKIANHKYVERGMLKFFSKTHPMKKEFFLNKAGYGNFF